MKNARAPKNRKPYVTPRLRKREKLAAIAGQPVTTSGEIIPI